MIVNLSGHRPFQFDKKTQQWVSKLEYTNDNGILVPGKSKELYRRLIQLFEAYYFRHPTIEAVITGMAMGVDLAGAEAAVMMGIPVHAYVPYPGHGSEWKTFYKEEHERILSLADVVKIPEKGPAPSEFAKFLLQRNKDMVDDSNFTLALWDGTPGGTSHCVKYAQEKRGDAWGENLWPFWERHRGRV